MAAPAGAAAVIAGKSRGMKPHGTSKMVAIAAKAARAVVKTPSRTVQR